MGFDSKQEIWKFLEANIPSHDKDKVEGHNEIDPAPAPRSFSPSRPWASFNSEEELWEFLKTVILNNGKKKGQDREETDPVPNRQTGRGSKDDHTSNK